MDFHPDTASNPVETSASPSVAAPSVSSGRLTPARQTVLQILKATDRALTHHEIEQQAREKGVQFDRVTLYRALEWLVTKELANKVAAEDRIWRFSAARDDSHGQAYFHCTACGAVYCIDMPVDMKSIALPAGFKAQRTELMVRGDCGRGNCAR